MRLEVFTRREFPETMGFEDLLVKANGFPIRQQIITKEKDPVSTRDPEWFPYCILLL